jgi:benzoyl-CoA reductase/2-hydroxyglutaryl-CoA dehydratase subunit BcrC/BadD/HgdB
MTSNTKRSAKGLNTTRELYGLLKKDYFEAYRANVEGQPLAWVTSFFPAEILVAMGIKRFYPENYACVCAAKQRSVDFQRIAEAEGYSNDLCSYFRTSTGSVLSNKCVFEHPLPLPDILVATTSLCDTHLKWFQDTSRRLNKQLFVLDVPYNVEKAKLADISWENVNYYTEQLYDLIEFIEVHTGRKLEIRKLRETIAASDRAGELWQEISEYRKKIPCPMGAEDAFSNLYFLVCNSGTRETVEFYERLRDEIRDMVVKGQGVVPNERFRLMWDMIPQWYNMGIFNYFENHDAVFVMEYFNLIWGCRMDVDRPFESLSRKYIFIPWGNQPLSTRVEAYKRCVEEYKVNGMVIHSPWSCRPYLIGQLDLKRILERELGIPCLIIETDFCDERHHSEEQMEARIEAFIETLD